MCANCICYKFATMPFGFSWYLHKPTIKSQQHYSVTLGPNHFRFVVEKMHIVRSVSAQLTTVFIRGSCYIHCIAVKNIPLFLLPHILFMTATLPQWYQSVPQWWVGCSFKPAFFCLFVMQHLVPLCDQLGVAFPLGNSWCSVSFASRYCFLHLHNNERQE